ncbi:biglycan-like [Lampetra fluviatilis]
MVAARAGPAWLLTAAFLLTLAATAAMSTGAGQQQQQRWSSPAVPRRPRQPQFFLDFAAADEALELSGDGTDSGYLPGGSGYPGMRPPVDPKPPVGPKPPVVPKPPTSPVAPPQPPSVGCPFGCQCSLRVVQCSDLGLKSVPAGLPKDARMVDLQSNKITEIKQDDFKGLAQLHALFLVNNLIAKVHPKAFAPMLSLDKLYISHNRLTEVPTGLPPSLIELRIHENLIKRVPKDTFINNGQLHVIELGKNPLPSSGIEVGAFNGLDKLTYIRISYSKLTQLPKELPNSLLELHLEGNEIVAIEDEDLFGYPYLFRLGLSYNKITEVQNGSLAVSGNLRELHLDNNLLVSVPPGLSKLRSLNVVYLHSNKIKEVKPTDFCPTVFSPKRAQYAGISLYDNPIKYWEVPPSVFRCVHSHNAIHFGSNYRK